MFLRVLGMEVRRVCRHPVTWLQSAALQDGELKMPGRSYKSYVHRVPDIINIGWPAMAAAPPYAALVNLPSLASAPLLAVALRSAFLGYAQSLGFLPATHGCTYSFCCLGRCLRGPGGCDPSAPGPAYLSDGYKTRFTLEIGI